MTIDKEQRASLMRQIKRAQTLEYLACRVGGDRHRWVRCIPDVDPSHRSTRVVVHQCDVCLTIKRQEITKLGERLGSVMYEYPEGYLYHRNEDEDAPFDQMFSSQAVRAAMLDRVDLTSLPRVIPIAKEG